MRFSDIVRQGSAFHIKGSEGETHTLHRISEQPRQDRPKKGPPPVGPKVSETVEFSALDGEPLPKGPEHLTPLEKAHTRRKGRAIRATQSSYGINDMDRAES